MRHTRLLLAGTGLLAACSRDNGVKIYNTEPEVTFTSPADGQALREGEPVTLTALVTDGQSQNEDLTYTWTSTLQGELTGEQTITNDAGAVLTVTDLVAGQHTVVLKATDPSGATGQDSVTFSVVENEPPLVRFTAPIAGGSYAAGSPVHVGIEVTDDNETDLSAISLAWKGLPDMADFPTAPGSDGTIDFFATVTDIGSYSLSVEATDPLGATGTDEVAFGVEIPDLDGDGYIDVNLGGDDCNDGDAAVHPGQIERCNGVDDDCDGFVDEGDAADARTYYPDDDGDGFGDVYRPTPACTAPSGYLTDSNDCDDTSALVHPGATEMCNGYDDNCNGATDENSAVDVTTWYEDADGDSYGNPTSTYISCYAPAGFVGVNGDCDDSNAAANPAASEYCDGFDDDCDGSTDESSALDATSWYYDYDGDGFGDASKSQVACDQPAYYVADATDCDDTSNTIYPAATEYCNGKDDDCDGTADDSAIDAGTYYADADLDGYGDPKTKTKACAGASGAVSNSSDCDDTSSSIHPGASEYCNSKDDDCDGSTDESAVDALTWYRDADGDGYGNAKSTSKACSAPTGYLADDTDCDDTRATAHPGASEVWYDGIDEACDGGSDYDADGDGYDSDAYGGLDCDDTSAARYPGSATWNVPADYATIQDAVDAACTYDEIDVAAGTYTENVDFGYKVLDVIGAGSGTTTIDGGYDGDPAVTMPGGTLQGFTITDSIATNGGAVYVSKATDLLLSDLVVTGNLATGYGGGVYIASSCGVTIEDSTIDGNQAGTYGGGLAYTSSGSCSSGLTVTNTSVDGNSLTSTGYGGGAYVSSSLPVTFTDVTFDRNEVGTSSGYGGGLYLSAPTFSWTGGGASGNSAGWGDGGAAISTTTVAMSDLSFDDDAANYYYGGLYVSGSGTVDDVTVHGGWGQYYGVVYLAGGTSGLTVTGLDVRDSASSYYGTGYVTGTVSMSGSAFVGNRGSTSYPTLSWYASGKLSNTVIAANRAAGLSLTPSSTSATISVTNVTVAGNTGDGITFTPNWVKQIDIVNTISADNGGTGIVDASTTFTPGSFKYDDVYGNTTGYSGYTDQTGKNGNVAVDPDFLSYSSSMDPSAVDLHLQTGSALIDAGDPTIVDADGTTSDVGAYGGPAGDDGYTDDTDGDGMVDGWESAHGLDPATKDASGDLDGDGLSNLDEYTAGSDPEDANTDQDKWDDGADADPTVTGNSWDATLTTTSYAAAGYYLAFAGDTNADGKEDLLVGAPYSSQGWLVGGAVTSSLTLPSAVSSKISEYAYVGAGVGDTNADGYDDVVLAYPYNSSSAGSVYLFKGPLASTESTPDATLTGLSSGDYAGFALSAAGDVNADGKGDFVVGAPYTGTTGTNSGTVYLMEGPISSSATLSSATATLVGEGSNDYAGYSVGGGGDVDGDGYDDVVVGAYTGGASSYGTAYVVSGPVTGKFGLGGADAVLQGTYTSANLGFAVAGGGDADGDGYDDVLVTAISARSSAGAVYLFHGPVASGTASSADAVVYGDTPSQQMGRVIAFAGDMDGDGTDDVAMGTYADATTASNAGTAAVFLGPITGSLSVSDATVRMYGEAKNDDFGFSLAGGGDLNGDGFADLAIGAPYRASYDGEVYVLFGGW